MFPALPSIRRSCASLSLSLPLTASNVAHSSGDVLTVTSALSFSPSSADHSSPSKDKVYRVHQERKAHEDRSRRPPASPQKTSPEVEETVIEAKKTGYG